MKLVCKVLLTLGCFSQVVFSSIDEKSLILIRESLKHGRYSNVLFRKDLLQNIKYDKKHLKKSELNKKKPWEENKEWKKKTFIDLKKYENIAAILYYDETPLTEKFKNIAASIDAQKNYKLILELLNGLEVYTNQGSLTTMIWGNKLQKICGRSFDILNSWNNVVLPNEESKKEGCEKKQSKVVIDENYINNFVGD